MKIKVPRFDFGHRYVMTVVPCSIDGSSARPITVVETRGLAFREKRETFEREDDEQHTNTYENKRDFIDY